ncbi:DEAD/DEAH box helicase [Paenibacillus soyae]|uniref:DEAD/DEAH box helicase n=1 Tax=Paenibacillus soyae TaxID=2969249 RepID=A0A9X2MM09_9BACL|nr:DEAD/DEAH box helicase [Paenibacillus soyae]MCR2802815.1 DEAD/DEAH box helicase [Paenibacillus soyae]
MLTSILDAFHPVLSSWFRGAFGEPTDVQRQAWAAILEGHHTLIAAPTGSGKTLAGLLPCIHGVVTEEKKGDRGVRVLYITPLKALNNDIQHHVVSFAEQLEAEAGRTGQPWPGLTSGVRTGDTPSSKRAAMVKRPPELLITTPESLFILLTSEQGRGMLRTVRFVIVDEIHDLAGDKRGAHLSLSLERLERLTDRPLQRIGVSATQNPLWRVAQFLGGWTNRPERRNLAEGEDARHPLGYERRPVHIVESRMRKRMDVLVTMPDTSAPANTRDAVWLPILKRIFALMENCRSVLLFTNSRRLCERLVLRMNDHAGYELARAHHGSMSKEKRLEVEAMLKNGELTCLVATSSLELGIDVGHIDLVIQIDSPLDAASGIQRIGRAGHAVGDVSRGVVIIRQRGALPEAAVLGGMIASREIEPIRIPESPLDVMTQQIVAIVASQDITVDELYRLLLGCDSYRTLTIGQIESVLAVLAGLYPFARPILDWDREAGLLTKRGNTAIAAMTGAGTIPQSSQYPVHHLDSRAHLGELDEEFVHESRVGDVFLLGTASWMIRKIDKDRVYVSEASNSFSEIPFWRNEGPGRTMELGRKVGALLEELADKLGLDGSPDRKRSKQWSEWSSASAGSITEAGSEGAIAWLHSEYGMDRYAADELIGYAASQHAFSELPTAKRIVIEQYRDMMNQTHVILLNPFGRRVNRTWLLAIQRQFEKALPYQLYGNAKDNGIEFVLPEWDSSWLRMIGEVTPNNLEPLLTEAVTGSPLLAIAFRRIAETSLLLARSFTRVPMWQKRLRSEELLREALPYAESFPFLVEAMRECMHDYLDLQGLRTILEQIRSGDIQITVRETEFPSPMATQFLADYVNMRLYEGDGLDTATKAGLLHMSKGLAKELFGGTGGSGGIAEEALKQMEQRLEQRRPELDTPEGLYAYLKQKGDAGQDELAKEGGAAALESLRKLSEAGKAREIDLAVEGEGWPVLRWICADEADVYAGFPGRSESAFFVISRYAEGRMSFTEPELCERYPSLTMSEARRLVDEMVRLGIIRQAPFAADEHERLWCSSKVASQIVRLSIGEGRKNAKAMEPQRWCGYLAQRQHALNGTQLKGPEGLLAVIGRMQGLFLPAAHWESFLFPSRIANYRKEDLDGLCATGEVIWLGSRAEGSKEGKIAFFLASNSDLIEPYIENAAKKETRYPELLRLLQTGGASFLTQLSRSYGKSPSETLSELLELVWEGHASNDQFAPLRLSLIKKGKDHGKAGSGFGRWYPTGTLLGGEIGQPDETARQAGNDRMPPAFYWIGQLIDCYGIVTKELVSAYTPFRWDEVLPVLNRLEEWGNVTRGVFVEGAAAIQFTTPDIAGSLRASLPDKERSEMTVLSAMDPANPYGLFIDWPAKAHAGQSFARKAGSYVALSGAEWRFWVEGNGKRVFSMTGSKTRDEAEKESLKATLRAMFAVILRQQGLTKVVIDEWDGAPVAESQGGALLQELGAERDRQSYVLWMSRLEKA